MPYSALLIALTISSNQGGPQTPARRPANLMGRIPILEYHIIGDHEARWTRRRDRFRADLEMLYARGYRPVTISQLLDRKIDLPAGMSPVVFTFDDASPSQFRYVQVGDSLVIDSTSAVGIWLDFEKTHPDWPSRAVFCMLPAAAAGHAFFGEDNIEGQKKAWRFPKVRFLAAQGFELCGHTLWHADLAKYSDDVVQAQIARGVMAIDSAVPGYRVRTFALPLGVWPRNHALARAGSWHDSRGSGASYHFDAILEVTGPASYSPYDPRFDPLHLPRIQVTGDALERMLNELDRTGTRYVSSGATSAVTQPR